MEKNNKNEFLDKIQETDFIETLRLGERNSITVLLEDELRISHKLAKKIAQVASFQGGKTILLVNALNGEGDREFMEDKPDNLEVVECGYNDFTGFIAAMARIATTNEDVIIVSDATPPFVDTHILLDDIQSYGDCCNQFRKEVNRLGKNMKLILIGCGEPDELSSRETVWFDNILDIVGTKYPGFYSLKDRKSHHYPLRDEIVAFSIENDLDCIHFFKEKKTQE